ncbi:hypothetical protein [Bradyrhizobium ivorense]|uniref:hypothetical protein n=1 Tax=Bradyrhizobium ivorense TaxID=2511166 RepID=UPI001AEE8363|nr:hypothetical protein [Bradyrhizobium ivorense]
MLADQDKRFLIVIDDIDRLALDEGGARGDETMLETVIPVKEISSHLATYLHPLSASLFERFGVTGLSLDRVEAELDKMKANRFGGLRSAPPPRRGRS